MSVDEGQLGFLSMNRKLFHRTLHSLSYLMSQKCSKVLNFAGVSHMLFPLTLWLPPLPSWIPTAALKCLRKETVPFLYSQPLAQSLVLNN